ncbi:hypothetical protein SEVIR_2G354133v4 [Setaria viridis]|nr:uncharacterized protein LOC117843609 [Setaria viridis]
MPSASRQPIPCRYLSPRTAAHTPSAAANAFAIASRSSDPPPRPQREREGDGRRGGRRRRDGRLPEAAHVRGRQRSATKVAFPLVWSNTCCSHPLYRESELIQEKDLGVRNAAQRKVLDELGIPAEDAPVDQFTPVGRMLYMAPSDGKWSEHELTHMLFIVRDVKLHPNPDEVADVKYVNREQLKELIRKASNSISLHGITSPESPNSSTFRCLLVVPPGTCDLNPRAAIPRPCAHPPPHAAGSQARDPPPSLATLLQAHDSV